MNMEDINALKIRSEQHNDRDITPSRPPVVRQLGRVIYLIGHLPVSRDCLGHSSQSELVEHVPEPIIGPCIEEAVPPQSSLRGCFATELSERLHMRASC